MSLKKIGIVAGVMLTVCGSSLWAAYAKIGDYRDVEVVNVTWRGIEVLHRDGGCILTEKSGSMSVPASGQLFFIIRLIFEYIVNIRIIITALFPYKL